MRIAFTIFNPVKIDPSVPMAALALKQAQLEAAKAGVASAKVDVAT